MKFFIKYITEVLGLLVLLGLPFIIALDNLFKVSTDELHTNLVSVLGTLGNSLFKWSSALASYYNGTPIIVVYLICMALAFLGLIYFAICLIGIIISEFKKPKSI